MEVDDYYSTEESGNWSSRLNSTEICRVCANSNGYLIPIYEGEGLDNELAMKIQKHLPIQISEEDTFPKQVCYQCASTLIAWHELVITCVEADRKIRNIENEEDDEDYQVDNKIIEETPAETCIVQIKTAKSLQPSISDEPVSEEQSESEKGKNSPVKRRDALKDCTTVKIVEVKTPTPGPSAQQASSKSPNVQEIMVDKERTSEDVTTSERCQQPPQTSFKAFQQAQSAVWNMYYQKDNTSDISHAHLLWIKKEEDISDTVENCNVCGENFDRKCDLATHLRKTHSEYVYHCDKCDEICSKKEQFLSHMKSHEEHSGDDGDVWSDSYDVNSYDSEDSTSVMEAEPKKVTYLEQIAPCKTEFLCNVCGKGFTRKYDLKRHSKCHMPSEDMHTDLNKQSVVHVESDKEEMKSDQDPLLENSKETKKKRNYVTFHCDECGKNFTLKDSYFRHMRIHTGEKPFTCHICGKQFRDSGGLARHLKDVHAGIKNFSCEFCGRSFASKATREDHRRIHTGERPYICDSCGKTFKSKASLYIHSKIHTDSFPHPCSYCEKRFRRRQELLAHVTTHTGEKPHGCDICGKCFRVRGELLRHKLIHSEDKPYICTSCGLSFRQKRYLKNHEKTRHGRRETST